MANEIYEVIDGHEVRRHTGAAVLEMDNTSKELREMASDLGVTRSRGDTKMQTALNIMRQAPHKLMYIELDFEDGFRLVPADNPAKYQ